MNGLFEDDANVRPQPKKKKEPQDKKPSSRKKSVGSRITDKVESRANIVGVARGTGVDFAEVDITPTARGKQKASQEDQGKIIPPINYVMDECDDDV